MWCGRSEALWEPFGCYRTLRGRFRSGQVVGLPVLALMEDWTAARLLLVFLQWFAWVLVARIPVSWSCPGL